MSQPWNKRQRTVAPTHEERQALALGLGREDADAVDMDEDVIAETWLEVFGDATHETKETKQTKGRSSQRPSLADFPASIVQRAAPGDNLSPKGPKDPFRRVPESVLALIASFGDLSDHGRFSQLDCVSYVTGKRSSSWCSRIDLTMVTNLIQLDCALHALRDVQPVHLRIRAPLYAPLWTGMRGVSGLVLKPEGTPAMQQFFGPRLKTVALVETGMETAFGRNYRQVSAQFESVAGVGEFGKALGGALARCTNLTSFVWEGLFTQPEATDTGYIFEGLEQTPLVDLGVSGYLCPPLTSTLRHLKRLSYRFCPLGALEAIAPLTRRIAGVEPPMFAAAIGAAIPSHKSDSAPYGLAVPDDSTRGLRHLRISMPNNPRVGIRPLHNAIAEHIWLDPSTLTSSEPLSAEYKTLLEHPISLPRTTRLTLSGYLQWLIPTLDAPALRRLQHLAFYFMTLFGGTVAESHLLDALKSMSSLERLQINGPLSLWLQNCITATNLPKLQRLSCVLGEAMYMTAELRAFGRRVADMKLEALRLRIRETAPDGNCNSPGICDSFIHPGLKRLVLSAGQLVSWDRLRKVDRVDFNAPLYINTSTEIRLPFDPEF